MLTELDTFLTRLVPPDNSDSGRKFGVGIYFFDDQTDSEARDAQPVRVLEEKSARATGPIEIDVLAGLASKK